MLEPDLGNDEDDVQREAAALLLGDAFTMLHLIFNRLDCILSALTAKRSDE